MNGIAYPVVREGDDEIAQLRARVQQLEKINSALMDRVERSIDMEGGAFSMFETAIALESVVRDRTSALEAAMSELNRVIAELAAANDDATAARILLRDAIETLNDGFALFDANDRMLVADIGHYESEQFTINLLQEVLAEKFPTFAVLKTGVKTNPVHYF